MAVKVSCFMPLLTQLYRVQYIIFTRLKCRNSDEFRALQEKAYTNLDCS